MGRKLSGSELIQLERVRHRTTEGWSDMHDDGHENGELLDAAQCYIHEAQRKEIHPQPPVNWPWESSAWNPCADQDGRIRPADAIKMLTKAGALVAAEIDRLHRIPKVNGKAKGAARGK